MKKCVALCLSLMFTVTTVIPTYASDVKEYINTVDEFIIDEDISNKEQMYDEVELIDQYFFNKEYLTGITLIDNEYVYTYSIPVSPEKNIVSNIKANVDINGNIEFDIKEGDIEDKLIYTSDGKIILNETEVMVETLSTERSNIVKSDNTDNYQPYALGSVYYDSKPFWGSYRDYTDYQGVQEYTILTDYLIKSASVSALSSIIGVMLPAAGVVLGVATIASTLIDAYATLNIQGKTLFYDRTTWDAPAAPSVEETLTSYYKYTLKWYTDSEYENELTSLREVGYAKTVLREDA